MNFAWLTDIHLDHLRDEVLGAFIDSAKGYDGYLITGDISNSHKLISQLEACYAAWAAPIYFVLGNHDFWGSSFASVRRRVVNFCKTHPECAYLSKSEPIWLGNTAIVGHDGWYDALHGDVKGSRFLMSDWVNGGIHDFAPYTRGALYYDDIDKPGLIQHCQELASDGVALVAVGLHKAIKAGAERVIVLTHVPPWREASWHEGKPGEATAIPWFTSKIMGDTLEKWAMKFPQVQFDVLCGHTHGKWEGNILPNLSCRVGGTDYGRPGVEELIKI